MQNILVYVAFQISFDIGFASDNVREVVLKVHERHQSIMNQQWNLKDTFLLSPDGFWQFYTYEVHFNLNSDIDIYELSFYIKIHRQ